LEELKRLTKDIVAKIPVSDDKKKRAIDVPSELISPLYESVSGYDLACLVKNTANERWQFGEAQLRNRIISHPDVGQKWYPDLYIKYSQQTLV
jgi:hypothetical protein